MENSSSNSIRFLLNDLLYKIDFSDNKSQIKPTTTLLNFLRTQTNLKSVKEGCAEGDCGACTVVMGETEHNQIHYTPVNSCLIFLPMINGKQIITTEYLSEKKDDKQILHPIQSALAETYGTQCGYCTPGILMTMFAIYKNYSDPDEKTIKKLLSGNLCRCTGYLPILEAVRKSSKNREDKFSQKEKATIEILKNIKNHSTISIKQNSYSYHIPCSLNDALDIYNNNPEAIIINGATDTAIRQTKNNEKLFNIIDISHIEELKYFRKDNDNYYIGAGLCIQKLLGFLKDTITSLYDTLEYFGSWQIRNLATIGGNVSTASPIGDTLPVLISLKSSVKLKNITKERIINIEDFIIDYRKTSLKKDELLTEVIIPKTPDNNIIKSYKVSKRKELDISTVSVCFNLSLGANNVINEIIITYGGMAKIPCRAKSTEKFLTGKKWCEENIKEAGKILFNEFEPISDARAEAMTRKIICRNLLTKFWSENQN